MILDKHVAKKTAKLLLQISAIKLSPSLPFTWASGWKSPIYCDNRIILSYPPVRGFVREEIVKVVKSQYGKPDVIAGVATGAIAIGVLVAQQLDVPFVYVRAELKGHGRKNQIEGHLKNGQDVVLIEDLISSGKSSLNAVKALRKEGAAVLGMAAIFSYGFGLAKNNFIHDQVPLVALCSYPYLLEQALNTEYITKEESDTLSKWIKNPDTWNA